MLPTRIRPTAQTKTTIRTKPARTAKTVGARIPPARTVLARTPHPNLLMIWMMNLKDTKQ